MSNTRRAVAMLALAATTLTGCGDAYKESQGTTDAPILHTERDGWIVNAPHG